MSTKKLSVLTYRLAVTTACILLSACGKKEAEKPPEQEVKVGIYTVQTQSVPLLTELSGRTSPFQVAEVRPQVSGIVLKRNFVEGSDVKAGTPLYQIDPAPYNAQFNSAKANFSKAQANLTSAKLRNTRFEELIAIDAVSKQERDDAVATLQQTQADLQSAKATLETAQINLAYTQVKAPITGRIGRSIVTAGALVTAGQADPLTTVQQLDPIYVDVTQSSTELLRMKRDLENGTLQSVGKNQAKVKLVLEDGSTYAQEGKLQFSDVTVDQNTGTVTLRALFPNPKNLLLPGMYVRAQLEEGTRENALLVPQRAVTRNGKGEATTLVLNSENIVELRTLETERTIGNNWLVTKGVETGDRVIVEGLQKAKPGTKASPLSASKE